MKYKEYERPVDSHRGRMPPQDEKTVRVTCHTGPMPTRVTHTCTHYMTLGGELILRHSDRITAIFAKGSWSYMEVVSDEGSKPVSEIGRVGQ